MTASRRIARRWLVRGMALVWLAAGLSGCARTAVHDGRAMRVFRF